MYRALHIAQREGGDAHTHTLSTHQAPPAKPKTAYQYFCKEARPCLRTLPTDNDVDKVLQEYWEKAEAEEKATYEKMALVDKERYKKDCASSGFDPETGEKVPGSGSKRKASAIVVLGEDGLPSPRKPKKVAVDKPKPCAKKKKESDDEPVKLLPWAVPNGLAVSVKPDKAAMVPCDPEGKKFVGRSEAGANCHPRRSFAVPCRPLPWRHWTIPESLRPLSSPARVGHARLKAPSNRSKNMRDGPRHYAPQVAFSTTGRTWAGARVSSRRPTATSRRRSTVTWSISRFTTIPTTTSPATYLCSTSTGPTGQPTRGCSSSTRLRPARRKKPTDNGM